jgi:hypothetical protein
MEVSTLFEDAARDIFIQHGWLRNLWIGPPCIFLLGDLRLLSGKVIFLVCVVSIMTLFIAMFHRYE